MLKPYHPCPFCSDHGCLACDADRVQRAEHRRQQEEADEFLQRYKGTDPVTGQPAILPPHPLIMAMEAIQYGKEITRRTLHTDGVPGDTLRQRFAALEFSEVCERNQEVGV